MHWKGKTKTICKPGGGKWCIPNKSRPREMEVSEEQGWNMSHQEDQRKEPWEFHCGKELMVPRNRHHFLQQKIYLYNWKKVESTERALMLY